MRKKTLARVLRKKQHQLGEAPRELIDALSDDQILESYVTCSNCGAAPTTTQIRIALSQATCMDHFFELCDFATHHPSHGTLRSVGDHPMSTTKDGTTPPSDQSYLQALLPPSGEEPEEEPEDEDLKDYDDGEGGPTYDDLVGSALNSVEQILLLLKETTEYQRRQPPPTAVVAVIHRLEGVLLRYLNHITIDLEEFVEVRDRRDAELEEDEDFLLPKKHT